MEHTNSEDRIKAAMRKHTSHAGKLKQGKFGPIRLIIIKLLETEPELKPKDVLSRFQSGRLDDAIDALGASADSFSIVGPREDAELIEYSYRGLSDSVDYSTIRNIASDLRNKK